jgi:hypothetical protein
MMRLLAAVLLLGLVNAAPRVRAAEPADDKEKARIEAQLKALRERYAQVVEQLRASRRELARREEQLGVPDPAQYQADLAAAHARINGLRDRQTETRVATVQLQRELADVSRLLDQRWFRSASAIPVSALDVERLLAANQRLRALAESALKAEEEIDQIKRLTGPNADPPALVQAKARLELFRRQMEETRRELVPLIQQQLRDHAREHLGRKAVALERSISAAQDRERVLTTEMDAAEAALQKLRGVSPRPDTELLALRDEVARLERVRTVLAEEIICVELLQLRK